MLAPLLLAVTAGAVPDVTLGPDAADTATRVDAPIRTVWVFSDRARVRRTARIPLKGPVTAVRLPDLPGATWMDTVRAEAKGATVLRVETTPVQRQRVSIEQVEAELTALEDKTRALARLDAERETVQATLARLTSLAPAAPVPEKDRRAPVPWTLEGWTAALDFLEAERAEAEASLRTKDLARRDLVREIRDLQVAVQRMNLGAFSDRKVQVLVLLARGKRAGAEVELTYEIPGAFWKPAYDLAYDPDEAQVRLSAYGVVQQSTGEDWADVEVRLSTGMPGRDIALPELLTWTLGESKEFTPRPRARTAPRPPPRFPPPRPRANDEAVQQAAKQALFQRRVAELQRLAGLDLERGEWFESQLAFHAKAAGAVGAKDFRPSGVGTRSAEKKRPAARRSRPPSRPKAAMRRESMAAPAVEELQATIATGADDAPMSGVSLSGSLLSADSARVVNTPLSLFDDRSTRRPRLSDPDLPAMSAQGFAYTYTARTRLTIPSSNQAVRAPIDAQTYPVETFYEAAPALADNAYLKATVTNGSGRPILQGPVAIFVDDAFAGDGRLRTTPPKGTLELPFGADEDIALNRKVLPQTKTKGVFSKDEVTTYRVVIEVANYKKRDVVVLVRDVVPIARGEDVTVDLVRTNPPPRGDPGDDGVIEWSLDIAAGRTRSIELEYRITRPDGWILEQR